VADADVAEERRQLCARHAVELGNVEAHLHRGPAVVAGTSLDWAAKGDAAKRPGVASVLCLTYRCPHGT
jgi:hypothetical protein